MTPRLQLTRLEDRTTPITPVYVNDAWLGLANGTFIPDADPIQHRIDCPLVERESA